MAQIPRELGRPSEKGELLRPCDYFDLICGTSTGGLIAIMLGRLRYTVQDAIGVYLSLTETVFTSISPDTDAAFDHKVLEEQIKGVISNAPGNPDKLTEFADPGLVDWNTSISPGGCRTFVVALQTRGTGDNATLLRTYGTRLDSPSPGRIWEVCRATSAAPTFFRPIVVDRIKYGDGGLVANNPTRLAIQEASEIWPGRSIGCLLSLGTGEVAPNQLVEKEHLPREGWAGWIFASLAPKSKFQLEVAKWCVQNTTRCAKVHNDILANVNRDGLRGTYFRLNTPDIGNIGLEEWERMDDMFALARDYMAPRHMRELKSTIARQIIQSTPLPPQPSYSAPRGEHQAHVNSLTPQLSVAVIEYTQAQNDGGTAGDSSTGTYRYDSSTTAH
ncbi:FabD/lysophospholipase-like protein [Zopfia rhizophila CBS 207.26]|uniref:FabD/lysophospholipase-like protein n=1 Tax=Zopfia rhizophila CBS 207.26 TaxID=1314779 RepID=A0A6A6EFG6_9PEZI|nr:FabD/lysophospholipase-like protein [Zopfia rhizophila CBS 207.26]